MSLTDHIIRTRHGDLRVTESAGGGLPIVMLHGSGSTRTVFDQLLASPVADFHRVIAIDLPGHGDSTDAPDPQMTYTLRGLANAVAAVIDALDVHRFALYGWSLGGHVAIELSSFHRGIAGIMLSGAAPVSHGPFAMLRGFHASWDMLLASKENFSPRDVERYAALCYADSLTPALRAAIERADGKSRSIFSRSLLRGEGADQKYAIEHSRVPIAMINGEHDPFVRLSYIAGLDYRMLWESECYVIQGAGHAVFLDAPETFEILLGRFAGDVALRHADEEFQFARSA